MGGFIFTNILNSIPVVGLFFSRGYRPIGWSFAPQAVALTVNIPTQSSSALTTNVSTIISSGGGSADTGGTTNTTQNNNTVFETTTYYFDAILREDHDQALEATRHPVQNGAALTDHAFMVPARVLMEVGFSDAMDSFVPGQYSAFDSKSVSAYQTFLYLQQLRIPMTLQTRLNTYQNMLIESLRPHEDLRTRNALRMTIVFKQILMGNVSSVTSSSRPNQSQVSNPGSSTPQPVPPSLQGNQDDNGDWSSSNPGLF